MSSRKIKVAALQVKTMPGTSREEKVQYILKLIEKASDEGCQIIMPPELCTTDYEKFYTKDPEYFKVAEPVPGPTTDAVGELTKKYKNYVIMPLFERKAPGIYYNSAATVGPDGTVTGDVWAADTTVIARAPPLAVARGI